MKKWKKPTKNFYMMPNDVFNLGLDPYEFMILSYLVRRMNSDSECWPSFKTMSEDLGISISTLEKRIPKMEKRGLISVRKHTTEGKHQNNVYTIYSLENPEIYRDPDAVEDKEPSLGRLSIRPCEARVAPVWAFLKRLEEVPNLGIENHHKRKFPRLRSGASRAAGCPPDAEYPGSCPDPLVVFQPKSCTKENDLVLANEVQE